MSKGKPNYNNQNQNKNTKRQKTLREVVFVPMEDEAINSFTSWVVRKTRTVVPAVLDFGWNKGKELIDTITHGKIKALEESAPKQNKTPKGEGKRKGSP